jgi:cytochrome c nitrite reductase small subunit
MGIRSFFGAPSKWVRLSALLLVMGAVVGFYVSFGPPGLYAKSSTPEFCAQCHVMEAEYEGWVHNGGHRRLKCVDCHLPNDNLPRHMVWKGMEGMWDSFAFYSGRVPERIEISDSGKMILQENCRRCHEETIARISEDRPCWQCHRRLSHRNTGAF